MPDVAGQPLELCDRNGTGPPGEVEIAEMLKTISPAIERAISGPLQVQPRRPRRSESSAHLTDTVPACWRADRDFSFESSGEPCRTVRGEGNQRLALSNQKTLPLDLIGLFGPLANRFMGPRNRMAADWAGTRVNGQIEKFARIGYQIAPVIAIAGGADV